MASLSDMTVTVELTDKAQTQLDFMLAEIQGIRAEIAGCADTRRKLAIAEEKLGALNTTCAWQGHELLRLQRERDEYKHQRDTWQRCALGAEAQLDRIHSTPVVPSGDFRQCMEENAALREWKDACPWDTLYKIANHSTVAYWTEIKAVRDWIGENMPSKGNAA